MEPVTPQGVRFLLARRLGAARVDDYSRLRADCDLDEQVRTGFLSATGAPAPVVVRLNAHRPLRADLAAGAAAGAAAGGRVRLGLRLRYSVCATAAVGGETLAVALRDQLSEPLVPGERAQPTQRTARAAFERLARLQRVVQCSCGRAFEYEPPAPAAAAAGDAGDLCGPCLASAAGRDAAPAGTCAVCLEPLSARGGVRLACCGQLALHPWCAARTIGSAAETPSEGGRCPLCRKPHAWGEPLSDSDEGEEGSGGGSGPGSGSGSGDEWGG